MAQPVAVLVLVREGDACFFFMLLFFIIFLADKATDPSVSEQDWSAIQNFCDQVNTDPNG